MQGAGQNIFHPGIFTTIIARQEQAYRNGVDLLLSAWPGAAEAFERAAAER
jgi:hypothetical protein